MNKKILFLIFLIFFIGFNISSNTSANTFAEETIFAKVEQDGTFFYNSPIDDSAYYVFEIPKTYYVELLGNAEDELALFYSAKYLDVFGYVKKSDVSPVEGIPQTPFANSINFRVFALSGLDLKSTPSNDSPFNRIINVPYLCSDLVFYGKAIGDEMIPEKSNVWYYCKYISGTSSYYGFLYSDLCDQLSTIPQNTEILPKYNGDLFVKVENQPIQGSPLDSISPEFKVLAITLICLPCIGLIYLLFKPTKLVADNGQKGKTKIKRLKKSEFYEFDD